MTKFNLFLEKKGISIEEYKGYDAEKMAGLYNEFNEETQKEIEKLISEKADSNKLDKAIEELNAQRIEQSKLLNETLKEFGLQIKALSEGQKKSNVGKTIKEILVENKSKLDSLGSREQSVASSSAFSFKAVGDMLTTTNVGAGTILEDRIEGVNTLRDRAIRLLSLISRGQTTSQLVSWVYQTGREDAVNYTVEGATKNQIDFDLAIDSAKVQKITAYIKVSDEMIADVDFIESLIRTELNTLLLKKVETEVYSGAGGANALNGIYTQATAFSAGSFALAIDNANEVDVLTVAMNQIALAEHDGPLTIMMHPTDVTKLKMVKVSSTDKRYVERLALVGGSLSLDGVPIIQTTLVSVGTYLIGQFGLATLFDRDAVMIEAGLDGNDFTKNMRTIRAEWRGVLVLKTNDTTAFVKGTFATDKAALETV